MKKKFNFALVLLSIIFSSCIYSPHYVCELKSCNNIYYKAITGDIFDPELNEYSVGENVFLALPDGGYYVQSKKITRFRFMYEVFSKSENYKYKIEKIGLIFDGEEHNIFDYVTKYYPYDSAAYTPFLQSTVIPNYYNSYYHIGEVTIPTPQNNELDITITVLDENDIAHTFTYSYSIEMTFDMFICTA